MEQDLVATVVLKGGAGSGHHGHKGIPGHQGGSLPKGASAVVKLREPKFLNADKMSEEDKIRLQSELQKYADELGYPADKLVYFNYPGGEFIVGTDKYLLAMNYNPKTREITIYPDSLDKDEDGISHINRNLLAHEVMHDRFREFERQLHRQEATINKLVTGMEDNPVLQDDFTLKPEFREQYWAVDIKQRYYQYQDMRELLYQLPITSYGKSYIDVARKSSYGIDTSRALSENLAEVAAFGNSSNKFISKRWASLYNEINQGLYVRKLIPKYVPLVRGTGSLSYAEELDKVFSNEER